ncbi:MAG TPA: proton-conducting transporter membrane subunit, partial [Anaerolineae bacterium]|nr:proton-conducting transporter membrane subunit [Anaerolineae bacterium]
MVALVLAGVLIPILGGVLMLIVPRGWIKRVSQLVAVAAFVCSLLVLIDFTAAGQISSTIDLILFGGRVVFGVTLDKLSTLIGLGLSLVGCLIVIYSTGYLTAENREHPEPDIKRRYYFFLLVFIGSMAGLIYSSTLIGLLVFFELTGVCSWGLIGYYDDLKARKAALKAIITTQVASLGLYIATVILFGLSGSFQLSALASLTDSAKTV